MQAPRAWYCFARILFKTSTPLHQMEYLECQIEHLRKIYTSLEYSQSKLKNIIMLKLNFKRDYGCGIRKEYVLKG